VRDGIAELRVRQRASFTRLVDVANRDPIPGVAQGMAGIVEQGPGEPARFGQASAREHGIPVPLRVDLEVIEE
jgi:hypothetical protein